MAASRWLAVWIRAVIVPAARRGTATWVGCGLIAAVIFGPTAMQPADLTGMMRQQPGAAALLGATWLLLFVPTARMIVRPDVGYLKSLPGAPRAATALSVVALIGLQLPWLGLWLAGEGVAGVAPVAATTVVAAALGWLPLPRRRGRAPRWSSGGAALRAIHRRALWRLASDALVRGAGLAVLAGLAGSLVVTNNQLTGAEAAALGGSVMAVMLIPAQLGLALTALASHRASAWLAQASGMSHAARVTALAATVAGVHLAAAGIAVAVAVATGGGDVSLAVTMAGVALGTALGCVRAMLVHEASPTAASRIVLGAVFAAAVAVLCLQVFGMAGALAVVALGAVAVLMVPPPERAT